MACQSSPVGTGVKPVVVRSWLATAAVEVGLVMAGMTTTGAMTLVARLVGVTARRGGGGGAGRGAGGDEGAAVGVEGAGQADGVFEELEAERGEGGGDEDGEGDGGQGGGVEGAGEDQDHGPVPQVGAVGDLAEVDDAVAGQHSAGG